MRPLAAAAALWLCASVPAGAEAFSLALPLDCEIGTSCFIEDYVDNAPAEGEVRDFACGINTRDGHRGTDFALLSFDEIDRGVTVRAAAPGRVSRVRDGMADDRLMRGVTPETACGNAVLLDHGEGWQTLYCHLRKGSVAVAPGRAVPAGAALGLVGLSGQTNHPHLHITVLKDGQMVDPFRPSATGSCGDPGGPGLWAEPITYTRTSLITAGFSDAVPDLEAVRDGSARRDTSTPDAPLVVYAHAGYAQDGDLLTIEARGPQGAIFRQDIVLETPRVSAMRAFGRRAPEGGWPLGDYLGEATLTRQGRVIAHRFAHVTVSP